MNNLNRKNVSSGSPYEPLIGISRASRIGNFIAVSGTAPIGPDGKTVGIGDPRVQARRCIEIIQEALQKLGAELTDVIRTRLILTTIDDWKVIAEVHGEYFKDIRPACTIIEISRFVNPEWLVHIEVDAITSNEG
jgi:enamine deaminase RidA (YjgF/YER057c/UK114 family)